MEQGCPQWDVAQLSTAGEPGTARAAEVMMSLGPAGLEGSTGLSQRTACSANHGYPVVWVLITACHVGANC